MVSIFLFSFVMLIGSFLSGIIPLFFAFSENKMKLVTVFGAGLLIGTALTVIIPEGVHAMYSSNQFHTSSESDSVASHVLQSAARQLKSVSKEGSLSGINQDLAAAKGALPQDNLHLAEVHEDHHDDHIHQVIGIALILGFVFMLIVDHFSGHSGHTDNGRSTTATIGLVVHAAADGIALGAASSMSQFRTEMIVFIAIMLHKGPAAFGLVSFLLHSNVERGRIRKYLFVFCLAAPLVAIITYFGLGKDSKEELRSINATGVALLFSGGTFLFVATVHILPELMFHMSPSRNNSSLPSTVGSSPSNNSNSVSSQESGMILKSGFKHSELLLVIAGSFLPVFLSLWHKH